MMRARYAILAVPIAAAAVATFLMARFVAAEEPVAAAVVSRGWIGFFIIFAALFAIVAAALLAMARRGTATTPGART